MRRTKSQREETESAGGRVKHEKRTERRREERGMLPESWPRTLAKKVCWKFAESSLKVDWKLYESWLKVDWKKVNWKLTDLKVAERWLKVDCKLTASWLRKLAESWLKVYWSLKHERKLVEILHTEVVREKKNLENWVAFDQRKPGLVSFGHLLLLLRRCCLKTAQTGPQRM